MIHKNEQNSFIFNGLLFLFYSNQNVLVDIGIFPNQASVLVCCL